MRKSIAITAAAALLGVAGFAGAQTAYAQDDDPQKVWVCKYVGEPGEDERIKEGKNPIHVAAASVSEARVGASFPDAQGRSVVVSLDEAEPDAGICEDFLNPPTDDPTEEPTTDPTEEPTTDPTEEPTTDPTDDPTTDPTTDPTDDPTTDPTTDPTDDPKDDDKDDPKDDDKGSDDPNDDDKGKDDDRGVPAKTGGEGDLGALALIGSIGLAASGGVLVASRRKH